MSERAIPCRSRAAAAWALGITVALGLLSRRYPLPGIFAEHTGDALYAVAVYWTLCIAAPECKSRVITLLTLAFCVIIECSQLWQASWLVAMRGSLPGRLVLGQGFQVADLVAYAIGTALAWVADQLPATALRR